MRNLIVLHTIPSNLSVSGPVNFLSSVFNEEFYRNLLLQKYGLIVITPSDIKNEYKKPIAEFIREDLQQPKFFNSVILGLQLNGHSHIDKKLSSNKIKFIGWQDDVHAFSEEVRDRDVSVQKYCKKYTSPILDKLDYLITPSSVYFKNLEMSNYYNKIVDIFYFLNPVWFEKLLNAPRKKREDKIILSGAVCSGYTSRLKFNSLKSKSPKFNDLIYRLPHPGYNTARYKLAHPDHIDNSHMTGMNYYNKLSEFKGAFVGHYNFPINFCLAKHIEVLMCGCLGFYEPNPLLETQLGLKEFEHYVPCFKDGKMIEDYDFYKNWLDSDEGAKIAARGQAFVVENFGNKQIEKLFSFLQTC